ncbi:phage tail protein [Pseudomonas aeruginosa]|uniref:phage tail-collar fiber domain-containing protein n=1 Tax=Pseudomonas aeruginosa TaxID=287 RepID=UPI0009A430F3|nr:phage tail protein [Pseudomonas aeruginosa]
MAQQEFYTILTAAGLAYEANRKAGGLPIKLTQMSVGDGNGAVYNPDASQTALRREVWRGPINALLQDATNPSYLVGELSLPDDVGGWYVREVGFWTDTGVLYAIGKYPESFKPLLAAGAGKEFYIRAIFETSNAESVTLVVDDTVVKATRAFVIDYVAAELAKRDSKNSVRVATTGAIVLSGAQSIDGVAVVAGDRVLVKNQAVGSQNGIYVVATGAWSRAADADASIEVTPGLLVPVEAGTANGDSVWQLVTDAPITLGTTALVFEMLAGRTGVSAGTYRSITVDKYGRVTGGTNPTTLSGYGITDALGCKIGLEIEAAAVSWNTLVAEGLYPKLILGTNPDGPGTSQHFYCRTYVRISVNGGTGALQQFAEPYGTPTGSGQMYWRGLNGTTWSPWVKVIDSADYATLADAEAGTAENSWMSPLRVFQAIAKKVVQATETVLGIAKIATQLQTNAGTDDATIVTPKKLRWGFAMSFTAASGYLLLPTWLGGALFQYGRASLSADTETVFTWPLAWPDSCYALAGGVLSGATRIDDGVAAQFRLLTNTTVVIQRQDIGTVYGVNRDIFVLALGK